MKFVETTRLGRIYSGRHSALHYQASANRRAQIPRGEDEVLAALFDIPNDVLERVSAQV